MPLQRFLASPKAGCLFISLDGFGSSPLKSGWASPSSRAGEWAEGLGTLASHQDLISEGQRQELCPGPTGDAASPSSLDSSSLQAAPRTSDPTNPSKFGPLPTRVAPVPFQVAGSSSGTSGRYPGMLRVLQGDTQGCWVVSGGNHSNRAASLLSCWQFAFSSYIKVDPLQLLSPSP